MYSAVSHPSFRLCWRYFRPFACTILHGCVVATGTLCHGLVRKESTCCPWDHTIRTCEQSRDLHSTLEGARSFLTVHCALQARLLLPTAQPSNNIRGEPLRCYRARSVEDVILYGTAIFVVFIYAGFSICSYAQRPSWHLKVVQEVQGARS